MEKAEPKRKFWVGCACGACAAVILLVAWLGLVSPPAALAQIPDSGDQRLQMIKELKESNRQLTEIAGLLREIRDDARKDKTDKRAPDTTPKRP